MVQIAQIDKPGKTISGTFTDNSVGIEMLGYIINGILWSCLEIGANDYYDEWERLNIQNTHTNLPKEFLFKWPH